MGVGRHLGNGVAALVDVLADCRRIESGASASRDAYPWRCHGDAQVPTFELGREADLPEQGPVLVVELTVLDGNPRAVVVPEYGRKF